MNVKVVPWNRAQVVESGTKASSNEAIGIHVFLLRTFILRKRKNERKKKSLFLEKKSPNRQFKKVHSPYQKMKSYKNEITLM